MRSCAITWGLILGLATLSASSPAAARPDDNPKNPPRSSSESPKAVSAPAPAFPFLMGSPNVRAVSVGPNGQFIAYYQGQGDEALGLTLVEAGEVLRRQLKLPEGQGVVVSSLTAGGPADQVGLKVNDILLALDGQPIGQPEDLTRVLKSVGEKVVPLTLRRMGQPVELKVRPVYHVSLAPAHSESTQFYIGLQASALDETLRSQLLLKDERALLVDGVMDDSPAAKAGIKPGDVLLYYDQRDVGSVQELVEAVQARKDQPTAVRLYRDGEIITLEITAMPRPANAQEKGMNLLGQGFGGSVGRGYPIHSYGIVPGSPFWHWGQADKQTSTMLPFLGQPAEGDSAKSQQLKDLERQVKELRESIEALKKDLDKSREK